MTTIIERSPQFIVLDSRKKNPEGWLILDGIVATTGTLEYEDRTDYVTEQALTGDSLDTLAQSSVTIHHPEWKEVNSKNHDEVDVGSVANPEYDEEKEQQRAEIVVKRQDAIDFVEDQGADTLGLSPGYDPKWKKTPNEDYDREQIGRRNNHVAITPNPRNEDSSFVLDSYERDPDMNDEDEQTDETDNMEKVAEMLSEIRSYLKDMDSKIEDMSMKEEEEEEDAEEDEKQIDSLVRDRARKLADARETADKLGIDYDDSDGLTDLYADVVSERTDGQLEVDSLDSLESAFQSIKATIDLDDTNDADDLEGSMDFQNDSDEDEKEPFEKNVNSASMFGA